MKKMQILAASLLLATAVSGTALAGSWVPEDTRWRYEISPIEQAANGWYWIDADNNGISECYYFDADGYLLTDTATPDNYSVNADGAWVIDGVVQEKMTGPSGATAQEDSIKQLYLNAALKNNALGSMAAHAATEMDMDFMGISLPIKMDMDIKMSDINSGSMKYLTTMRMDMLGTPIDTTAFYTNGWYYMDMYGTKMKTEMPLDAMMAEVQKNNASLNVSDADYLTDMHMTVNADGSRTIHYKTDTSKLMEEVNAVYASLGMSAEELSYESMNIQESNGVATINAEGYIVAEQVYMVMDMTIEGEFLQMSVYTDVRYENPGQPVQFELPSTAGYEDINALS